LAVYGLAMAVLIWIMEVNYSMFQETTRRAVMKVSKGFKIHFLLTVLFLIALFLPAVLVEV
jgi:hypothetical protein